MKIAIAQLNLRVGDFADTFEKVAKAVQRANFQKCDMLVLSELTTTGYPPRDLLLRNDFVEKNLELLHKIMRLSDNQLGILVGHVDWTNDSDGKPLRNCVSLCYRGRIVATTFKSLLPTYDVFDEDRYFEPGKKSEPMPFKDYLLGVVICEDHWNDKHLWKDHIYHRDPVKEQVEAGAQVIINCSASPFVLGKQGVRYRMCQHSALEYRKFVVYANQVGGNDELVFDGNSMFVGPDGTLIKKGKSFEEDIVVYDIQDSFMMDPESFQGDYVEISESDTIEDARKALVLGTRDYVRKCGFKKAVIGLSGGIDSAVTACIAVEALGSENVVGITMPSEYSSEGSISDSEALAKSLDIKLHTIPIKGIYDSFISSLGPLFKDLPFNVAEENIQARARGAILMAYSNKFGNLVLTTGNKSEIAVGYCTLYGDMCGGLAVISDIPKMMVYELARHLNKVNFHAGIPQDTIDKPPSAELRPGQMDQDSLPPYPILDQIIEQYVELCRAPEDIRVEGASEHTIGAILKLIDGAEYKRRQAAPGLKITTKAFGVGRRYPVAAFRSK